jgi:hypothetical protein
MQPRPSADTCKFLPSLRFCTQRDVVLRSFRGLSKGFWRVRQGGDNPHVNYPSPSAVVQDCLLRVETGIIASPMPKSVRRARRRHAKALRRTPRHDGAGGRSENPAQRDNRDQRRLLGRILDTPHLAHIVPRLQPEVLHRVIQSCGLEDCGELVALGQPDFVSSRCRTDPARRLSRQSRLDQRVSGRVDRTPYTGQHVCCGATDPSPDRLAK